MTQIQSLCVFCGASSGKRPVYQEAAKKLGQTLAAENIELVWGGGHVGLMGCVADATLAAGGKVFGVIPEFMADRELAHPLATELQVVDSMHTRKATMAERADGFIAMPGGMGTLDELFEILTWGQLQLHYKPIGLLNVDGFFTPLLNMIHHMVEEGFVRPHHLNLFCVADSAIELIDLMRNYQAQEGDWLDKVTHLKQS